MMADAAMAIEEEHVTNKYCIWLVIRTFVTMLKLTDFPLDQTKY